MGLSVRPQVASVSSPRRDERGTTPLYLVPFRVQCTKTRRPSPKWLNDWENGDVPLRYQLIAATTHQLMIVLTHHIFINLLAPAVCPLTPALFPLTPALFPLRCCLPLRWKNRGCTRISRDYPPSWVAPRIPPRNSAIVTLYLSPSPSRKGTTTCPLHEPSRSTPVPLHLATALKKTTPSFRNLPPSLLLLSRLSPVPPHMMCTPMLI